MADLPNSARPDAVQPDPPSEGAAAVPDSAAARLAESSASGLYAEVAPHRGELRIDVDGPDALMTVSESIGDGLAHRLHWIAKVAVVADGGSRWSGDIWYKKGTAALLPSQHVEVSARSCRRAMSCPMR